MRPLAKATSSRRFCRFEGPVAGKPELAGKTLQRIPRSSKKLDWERDVVSGIDVSREERGELRFAVGGLLFRPRSATASRGLLNALEMRTRDVFQAAIAYVWAVS
jgi:hypothetical protein